MRILKADLHMHTCFSDGKFSPEEIIKRAKSAGLSVISITDHDNVEGLDYAIEAGQRSGIEVIPGIEFSAESHGKEVHLLGYFIDYKNERFLNFLSSVRSDRMLRAEKMVNKLNNLGSRITMSYIREKAGDNGSVGRPHIASALAEEGFVKNYSEAFYKYIGDGKPAYERKPGINASDVIKLVSDIGGLSFIAHPGKYISEEVMLDLINSGLDGIEVIHPSHSPSDVERYTALASQYFLLKSGGSDFHGRSEHEINNFGSYYVSAKDIMDMRRRLF